MESNYRKIQPKRLIIKIPDNNLCERQYIIGTLLHGFLGLDFDLIIEKDHQFYSLLFDDKEVIISDSFFNYFKEPLSYLTNKALPGVIRNLKNEFTGGVSMPAIFGNVEFRISNNRIIIGLDIFASSFFLLTRWEEYVNQSRDDHDRFPGKESISYKNNFIQIPVVNVYSEFLWNCLKLLDYEGSRSVKKSELILTHDVDHLDYPSTFRLIIADILKRRNLRIACNHFKHYLTTGTNPYDYFDYLMSASESKGLKSHFYFMSSRSNKPMDPEFYLKSKRFKSKLRDIVRRGHIVGVHPGYYTSDDEGKLKTEIDILRHATNKEITESRQHYLRFKIPDTFRFLDRNEIKVDSTMGYADVEGFRCGTGNRFNVFDFVERKQLNIMERPLIIMDATLLSYRRYDNNQIIELFDYYIEISRKFKTDLTLLFHNSSFYGAYSGYENLYNKLLSLTV